jgi:hypothetical protein
MQTAVSSDTAERTRDNFIIPPKRKICYLEQKGESSSNFPFSYGYAQNTSKKPSIKCKNMSSIADPPP